MPVTHPAKRGLKFFKTPADLRHWLEHNHASETELWIGLYKKASGKPSITWPEAVDQLLCFGWIDGVRVSIDAECYANRATPRKPRSTWSAVNIRRANELIRAGLMCEPGRTVFTGRDPARTNRYSFEREEARLTSAQLRRFKADAPAWAFFESLAPSYRKIAVWWVVSAKQEETRERRFAALLADSAAGLLIAPMRQLRKPRSPSPR